MTWILIALASLACGMAIHAWWRNRSTRTATFEYASEGFLWRCFLPSSRLDVSAQSSHPDRRSCRHYALRRRDDGGWELKLTEESRRRLESGARWAFDWAVSDKQRAEMRDEFAEVQRGLDWRIVPTDLGLLLEEHHRKSLAARPSRTQEARGSSTRLEQARRR